MPKKVHPNRLNTPNPPKHWFTVSDLRDNRCQIKLDFCAAPECIPPVL